MFWLRYTPPKTQFTRLHSEKAHVSVTASADTTSYLRWCVVMAFILNDTLKTLPMEVCHTLMHHKAMHYVCCNALLKKKV